MQLPGITLQRYFQCSFIIGNIGCSGFDLTTGQRVVRLRGRIGPVKSIGQLYCIAFFQKCAVCGADFQLQTGDSKITHSTDLDLAAGDTRIMTVVIEFKPIPLKK